MDQGRPNRRTKLVDYDGDSIGTVVDTNPDFIVVEGESGMFGLRERRVYFLPWTIVTRQDESGGKWYTSVPKEEIDRLEWRAAPPTSSYAANWAEGGPARSLLTAEDGTVVRRFEEQLDVKTVVHQAGEIVITKQIVEEVRTIEVPVRREVVHVERRAVSSDSPAGASAALDAEAAFVGGESIRVPVMEEQIEVRKVPVAVEEIEIRKTTTEEKRRIEETVRREQVDVDDSALRSPTDPS